MLSDEQLKECNRVNTTSENDLFCTRTPSLKFRRDIPCSPCQALVYGLTVMSITATSSLFQCATADLKKYHNTSAPIPRQYSTLPHPHFKREGLSAFYVTMFVTFEFRCLDTFPQYFLIGFQFVTLKRYHSVSRRKTFCNRLYYVLERFL